MGTYLSLSGSGTEVGCCGRLFEVGFLLTFSAFRMGAYSSKYSSTDLCKSFFCAKCCMMSTMSIFCGYVSMRTGAILNLEGREALGRDPSLLSEVLHMTLSLNHSLIAVVSSHSMN